MLPQQSDLIDFIYRSNALQTPAELKEVFLKFIGKYGMDRFIMGQISHDSTAKKLQNMDIIANYPTEWLKHYKEQQYVEHDIVYQTALKTHRPFTWNDITYGKKIHEQSWKILKEAQEFKLFNGVGLSIHEPNAGVIGMGLSSSEKDLQHDRNTVHIIYAAANQFFTAYSDLVKQYPPNEDRYAYISVREREILLWLARGKRRHEIADLLCITESAVKKHCENIFRKLQVNSTQLVIVKSLRMGLINPF